MSLTKSNNADKSRKKACSKESLTVKTSNGYEKFEYIPGISDNLSDDEDLENNKTNGMKNVSNEKLKSANGYSKFDESCDEKQQNGVNEVCSVNGRKNSGSPDKSSMKSVVLNEHFNKLELLVKRWMPKLVLHNSVRISAVIFVIVLLSISTYQVINMKQYFNEIEYQPDNSRILDYYTVSRGYYKDPIMVSLVIDE